MGPIAPGEKVALGQEYLARRRRVRRTTLVVTAVVLFFYFGFIALMLVRAHH